MPYRAVEALRGVLAARPIRTGEGLVGRVAATGEPTLVPRVDAAQLRAAVAPEYRHALDRLSVESLCAGAAGQRRAIRRRVCA